MAVPFDFKKEEDVKLYLQNIFAEYQFLCYHEKDAKGCHLLGDFFETVKKDSSKAMTLYKNNCDDSKYGHSCMKYGDMNYVGKGCDKNLETALAYYKKGCEYNHYRACLQGGTMLTMGKEGIKRDYKKGLELLEKGCDGQFPMSCFFASTLYLTGADGLPKDVGKAFHLTKKACDLGVPQACFNLSQMYQMGVGTDKDEKLAESYKQKVTDFNEQLKTKIEFEQTS